MSNCKYCNNLFEPKNVRQRVNTFCSQSCVAKFYNSLDPKRKKVDRLCKGCNLNFHSRKKVVYCPSCRNKIGKIKGGPIIIKDRKKPLKNASKTFSSQSRMYARRMYIRSGKPLKCHICSYSKFVDICHIIPVKDFPIGSTIEEISRLDNLVALCPNHHKEFDTRLVTIDFTLPLI